MNVLVVVQGSPHDGIPTHDKKMYAHPVYTTDGVSVFFIYLHYPTPQSATSPGPLS